MTQQERIEQAAIKYGCDAYIEYCRQHGVDAATAKYPTLEKAFITGAEWMLRNQWISVDEELPKDYEDVFILYDHGIPSVGYCEKINGEIKWYRRIDRTPIIMVTHWMEIPTLEGGDE